MEMLVLILMILSILLMGMALGMLCMLSLLCQHITMRVQRINLLTVDYTRQSQQLATYQRNGITRKP